jgi:general stress protein 26
MANQGEAAAPRVVFDPVKLEQLNVSKDYPMEPEDFQRLFVYNSYCEMAHIDKRGYPIVTPMFYVIRDGFLQMSSIQKHRHKVHHLIENPKISVGIHNDGCNLRHQKAILMIGHAEIYTDDAAMREIHWDIINKYWTELTDPVQREAAFAAVHTPLRAIIKVHPEKLMHWDFGKMIEAYDPGVWFGECAKLEQAAKTRPLPV